MQDAFYNLADRLTGDLVGQEVLLARLAAEKSDFVRFSQGRVRQAGSVDQRYLTLDLILGRRRARGACTLTGRTRADRRRAADLLVGLRRRLPGIPEDPYLLYATEPVNTEQVGRSQLPDSQDLTAAMLDAAAGLDMVGILAAGGIFRGFANSLGQRNWFASYSFHADWSFYHQKDKAVKTTYAGFEWDAGAFAAKVEEARRQLAVLARPPKTVPPGGYAVYLAPAALAEIVEMISGGFGLKAQRTKTTCLLKMLEDGRTLHPCVCLRENTAEGSAPNFQAAGFVRPASVTLIEGGRLGQPLVSPRSAKEYGARPNGEEVPQSLDLSGGDVPSEQAPTRLGTGIYVGRLWYLNFSDTPACRITGMTRFGTFWVEGGQIVAPLNVMRFDETIYRMLGRNLQGLTCERQFLPNPATYGGRSTLSQRLPGALVDDFSLTL